jgi:repressor LexA
VLTSETICVPRDMLGRGRTYALRVSGDSMIGDNIHGDFLIVEADEEPRSGQIVVALIDGEEATLKRFYRERGRVRLQPANADYEPIYVKPPGRVLIQGVYLGLIRKGPRLKQSGG